MPIGAINNGDSGSSARTKINAALTAVDGLGNASTKNVGTSAGDVAAGDDGRFSDARTPTNHASNHTNGTDDIQDATASQKGLATATQITKLDGIEAGADVTDAGNVGPAIGGATAITTLGDTDQFAVVQSNVLKTIAYSALKTLLGAIYQLKNSFASLSTTTPSVTFSSAYQRIKLTISGATTFTASGYAAGYEASFYIFPDSVDRALTFPASWIWLEGAPTQVTANKHMQIDLFSSGTTEGEVFAVYAEEL